MGFLIQPIFHLYVKGKLYDYFCFWLDIIMRRPNASTFSVLSGCSHYRVTLLNDLVELLRKGRRPVFVWIILFALNSVLMFTGCSTPVKSILTTQQTTSVTPSSLGTPNSIGTLWPYEFVSVQGTG